MNAPRIYKHIDPDFATKGTEEGPRVVIAVKGDSPADMIEKTITAVLETCDRIDGGRVNGKALILAIQISIQTKLTINLFPPLIGGVASLVPESESFLRWEDSSFDKCGCTACVYAIAGSMFLKFSDRYKAGESALTQKVKQDAIRDRMLAASTKNGRPRVPAECPFVKNGYYQLQEQQ